MYSKRGKRAGRFGPAILAVMLAAGLLAGCGLERPEPDPAKSSPPAVTAPAPTPTPVPTPVSEPEPTPAASLAERTLSDMTLWEKICQLFIVYPSDLTGVAKVTAAGRPPGRHWRSTQWRGCCMTRATSSPESSMRKMLTDVQTYARIPLILTCDEEGGRVNRLMGSMGTTRMGPMLDYKDQGPDDGPENAQTIAADMRELGFNMDLAPVADVWSNPANTVIGDRAYSDDFGEAAELVAAAVEGFHAAGYGYRPQALPRPREHLHRHPLRRGVCVAHPGGAAARS